MPLQHMTYESQLAFKQQQVKNVMTKIAKCQGKFVQRLEWSAGLPKQAQIPVRMVDGQLTTGFLQEESHDLIPIEDFHIQDPRN